MAFLYTSDTSPRFSEALEHNRARVVRHCTYLTRDPEAAQDLAQEVLLIAWRNRHKLQGRDVIASWLAGITRNVYRHWVRSRTCERSSHRLEVDISNENLTDDFDLELDYLRQEAGELLARALCRLPRETREAVIQHYVNGEQQRDIAQHLHMTTGAVEARLRRGRRLLHEVLTTELGQEATELGLIPSEAAGWRDTRIWCATCGKSRLMMKVTTGAAIFCCLSCSPTREPVHTDLPLRNPHFAGLVGGLRQPRRIMDALHNWSHRYFIGAPDVTQRLCTSCGHSLTLRRYGPRSTPSSESITSYCDRGLYVRCDRCLAACNVSLGGILDALPEVRDFRRKCDPVRVQPIRSVDTGGRSALVGGFHALRGRSRIDVLVDAATLQPLSIHSTPSL